MKRSFIAILITVFSFQLQAQQWSKSDVEHFNEFDQLEKTFALEGDTIHVINFWATWCKPCVAELPYFEALHNEDFAVPVKITLVSLDFKHQIDSKLIPFLNDEKIKSEVSLLTDGKFNDFIDRVDPTWEGSIPATLFLSSSNRRFFEQEFHSTEELKNILSTL